MGNVVVSPKSKICGQVIPPGDKSISHRAVMFSAFACGKSSFNNFLFSDDCKSTIRAFKQMGVEIETEGNSVTVNGVGFCGLKAPDGVLDVGNSGTTMRLLSGILAGQSFDTVLTGDASLCSRPMKRVVDPLRLMGADISGNGQKHLAPLTIKGKKLRAINFDEELGSAQVKSCVLLAGLFADGKTCVNEKKHSRDHTERMLMKFNAPFEKIGNQLCVSKAVESLTAQSFSIPADISSAAFFIVAGLIMPNSCVEIRNVGLNPTRTGVINVLKRMGADITVSVVEDSFEPVGTITSKSSRLNGVEITGDEIPFFIDELPILMTAAAFAEGVTVISGAEELRVKETDRIASMVDGLSDLGVDIKATDDGAIINGNSDAVLCGNVSVNSFHDHRTAMSIAIAALRADADVTIIDHECVAISYPDFFSDLKRLTE